MKVVFEYLEEISEGYVKYFSVKLGSNDLTEFEQFDAKDFSKHEKELRIIYNVINEMQLRGSKEWYFVNESSAEYLPRVQKTIKDENSVDFGLRLYAKRMTDDIVILFNGDIKTKNNPYDCENVKYHCARAIKIGLLLDKAYYKGEIDFSEINPFQDLEFDI